MKKILSISTLFSITLITACVQQPNHQNSTSPTSANVAQSNAIETLPLQQPISLAPPYQKVPQDIYAEDYDKTPEVIQNGRYQLIAVTPQGGQKYLLEQIVNINIPVKNKKYHLNVMQGLQETLKNTGYQLCSLPDSDVIKLFNRPLPKVHYKFGPTKLRESLQMLAGEAYELVVDNALRQVCFVKR